MKVSYNMPRGNSGGAMYCIFAGTFFIWPVPPAQPASSVCAVMRSYHEWKTRFRRIPAELYSAFQAGEFAVRGSLTSSTSRIIDFSKDFQRFWETLQRSRREMCMAGDDNGGVAVFPRVFNGWRLFFTLARSFHVNVGDRSCAGIVDFP